MIRTYVGHFKLDRFSHLITLIRFISENSSIYENITFTESNYIEEIKKIIGFTFGQFDNCKNKSILDGLVLSAQNDFNSNPNSFINDFYFIIINNFSANFDKEFDFNLTNEQKLYIKKFWFLLQNIYTDLPTNKQKLCEI